MALQRFMKMSADYQKFIDDILVKVDDFIFSTSKAEQTLYKQINRFSEMYDKRLRRIIPILEKNYLQIIKRFNMTVALEIDGIPISFLSDECHIRACEGDVETFDKYMEETRPGNGYHIAIEGIPFGVSLNNEVDERIFWYLAGFPKTYPIQCNGYPEKAA